MCSTKASCLLEVSVVTEKSDWLGSYLPIRSGRLVSRGFTFLGSWDQTSPTQFPDLIRVGFVPNVKGLTIKKA
jgi:hypothetical protein